MAHPPDSAADLGILLTLALRGFIDELHSELARRGLADVRPPFAVVFRALRDEPLTLTDLASRLGVTKQAAAKVVDEMVDKRLLRRRASPTDARAKLLALTARGRRAMATAVEIGDQIDARLRAAAGTRAVDSMHATLQAFVELSGLKDDLARRRSPPSGRTANPSRYPGVQVLVRTGDVAVRPSTASGSTSLPVKA